MSHRQHDAKHLCPLDNALARIGADFGPVTGIETVPLDDGLGRILAELVVSPIDVPPLAVAAVDGYALALPKNAHDHLLPLKVVGRIAAGEAFEGVVQDGQAVRIFTGAPVPAGTDTVVTQEDCRVVGDEVTVKRTHTHGENVRPVGEDMRRGATILEPGRRLRAQEIGLAASAGRTSLLVRERLKVAVFSTGGELREPGGDKPIQAIYDSNRHTTIAQLHGLGAEVHDLGIVADQAGTVREALAEAARISDLVITSGGVSASEEDHVKDAVQELGSIDLWRLAIKPGKPLALGRVAGKAFLGLPGNPVSTMVCFMLVAKPLALRLMGATTTAAAWGLAVAGFSLRRHAGRREFLRARVEHGDDGRPLVRIFPNDSSGVLSSMSYADGLVDVPADTIRIEEGELVRFMPFCGLLG